MSYSIPLHAKTLPEAVAEASQFLTNAETAKLRIKNDRVFLFIWKGHVASLAPLDTGFYMLRGHNYGLRELIKGSVSVSVADDGSIVYK